MAPFSWELMELATTSLGLSSDIVVDGCLLLQLQHMQESE